MSLLLFNNQVKTLFVFFLGLFFCANSSYGQQSVRDSLVELLQQTESNKSFSERDSIHVNLLNQLSQNLRFYKADSLLRVAEQALNHSKSIDYKKGQVEALGNIGDYYSDKGNHEKATQNYKVALEIANKKNEIDLILGAQNQLANQYTFQRDYAKALEEYLTGIEIATTADHEHMLAILNENIALLYADQKDYEQALVYFKIVKKLNEQIGDEVLTAYTTSNMADTYADMGNLEYAMYHITNSIAVFEKYELMDWLAFGYEVKGKTYLKQGKYKWAIFWYNQSQSLHNKNVEDERSEIDLLNGIAEANMGLKKIVSLKNML